MEVIKHRGKWITVYDMEVWDTMNNHGMYDGNIEQYIKCECGSILKRGSLFNHKGTKKHQRYLGIR